MYCSKMEPKAGLYLPKGGGAVEKVVEKDTVWEGAGGVLGDEARPLLEHEAHRADEQRGSHHPQHTVQHADQLYNSFQISFIGKLIFLYNILIGGELGHCCQWQCTLTKTIKILFINLQFF